MPFSINSYGFLILLCSAIFSVQGYEHPGMHSAEQIAQVRARVASNAHPWTAAYAQLKQKATEWLSENPDAMADFSVPGYYGGGQEEHLRKKKLLSEDSRVAYASALMYALDIELEPSERQTYAEQAHRFIMDWAEKNTKYSDADGSLVMCYNGTALAFAAELLWDYPGFTTDDKEQFKVWLRTVLGKASGIKSRNNNWGDWGILASLQVNNLLDDDAGTAEDIKRLRELIEEPIEDDGSMPHEIGRGSSGIWYTYFSLAPKTAACEIARNSAGVDLFTYEPPGGGTLRQALDFLYEKGTIDPSQWPRDADADVLADGKPANLFQAMVPIYGDTPYLDWIQPPTWRDYSGVVWMASSLMQPLPLDNSTPAGQGSVRTPGKSAGPMSLSLRVHASQIHIRFNHVLPEKADIKVLDTRGKMLTRFQVSQGTNMVSWSAAHQAPGWYIVEAMVANQVIRHSFTILP